MTEKRELFIVKKIEKKDLIKPILHLFEKEVFEYLSLPEKEFPKASRHFKNPQMDRAYFEHLTDRFRSPHLWKKENGQWQLRHAVWKDPV